MQLTRFALSMLFVLPIGAAVAGHGPGTENLIPNGDFSQGTTGFTSQIPYIKPAYNCLWGGYYTLASKFNEPLLHTLIAAEPFSAPKKPSAKSQVFFANAGGKDELVIWATTVKGKPQTDYVITFDCISLSGYIEDGYPPHQVATMEWVPDMEIRVNNHLSPSFQVGCGKYSLGRMRWNSGKSTTANIRIVRLPIAHGGGLIGLSNIEMVPLKESAPPAGGTR